MIGGEWVIFAFGVVGVVVVALAFCAWLYSARMEAQAEAAELREAFEQVHRVNVGIVENFRRVHGGGGK